MFVVKNCVLFMWSGANLLLMKCVMTHEWLCSSGMPYTYTAVYIATLLCLENHNASSAHSTIIC